mmetsp:Transcript_22307/g.43457  ORF Transcript_22307/g.43457 Transcript_22307/m.43457 type:complete len:551 (+) Transcript_22307:67-1719(+)
MVRAGRLRGAGGGATSAVVPFGSRKAEATSSNDPAGQTQAESRILAVVPSDAPSDSVIKYDEGKVVPWQISAADSKEQVVPWQRRCEEGLLLALAVVCNVLCYVTYASTREFHGRLYDVIDAQVALLPGLDIAMIVFAVVGTASFGMMIILVECNKLLVYHELMNIMLYFSAIPCGVVCAIIVYFTEQTQWAPFVTLMAVLLLTVAWCIHNRLRYGYELGVLSKIVLDISWLTALIFGGILLILFASNTLKFITKSDRLGCPFSDNVKMPVYASLIQSWYCVSWDSGQRMDIERAPANKGKPARLSCSDTFLSVFGVSIEPHLIECPAGCLINYQGEDVVGCGIYSTNSPVCVAAIHGGVLTDNGGSTTVYGRVGVPRFQRCSRNSITSVESVIAKENTAVSVKRPAVKVGPFPPKAAGGVRRLISVPLVVAPGGVEIPQAFHFNNMEHTREFIWLQTYEVVSSTSPGVEDGKPWTRIQATVSARLAGVELNNEKILLGAALAQPQFTAAEPGKANCRVDTNGVLCGGAGAAAFLQLDFCRPEVKSCTSS